MSDLYMKMMLAEAIRKMIAPEIMCQGKEIYIPEIVRLVFDHKHELGITILPSPQDDHDHYMRKSAITDHLRKTYAQYEHQDALIRDIMTDLIAIAREFKLEIVVLCEA